jgi:hypothetical protein
MRPSAPGLDYRVANAGLSRRLREVREELFGVHGGPLLADELGLPYRTWSNYEMGVVVPAVVLLRFVELTGANPRWLLRGEGERYSVEDRPDTTASEN